MNENLRFYLFLYFLFLSYSNLVFADNSTCAEALIVGEGTYEVNGFTGDGAIFQGATAAVWYRYEPTEQGVFTVSSCNGGGNTRLVIMLMNDCANQSDLQIINSIEDNCDDGKDGNTASFIQVVAVPNISYLIYWDNGQSEDAFTWDLSFKGDQIEAEGTTCHTAQIIQEGIHTIDTLIGVGTAFTDAVSARWFAFTPQKAGDLFINSCESEVNTRLFIWEENCDLQQILAQDDDGCGNNGASEVENVRVEEGTTYYIYWDDHHSTKGFNFSLEVRDSTVSFYEPDLATLINVYPNPFHHNLFVAFEQNRKDNLKINIYNFLGQEILEKTNVVFEDGLIVLPTHQLEKGNYYIKIEIGRKIFTTPIVKM